MAVRRIAVLLTLLCLFVSCSMRTWFLTELLLTESATVALCSGRSDLLCRWCQTSIQTPRNRQLSWTTHHFSICYIANSSPKLSSVSSMRKTVLTCTVVNKQLCKVCSASIDSQVSTFTSPHAVVSMYLTSWVQHPRSTAHMWIRCIGMHECLKAIETHATVGLVSLLIGWQHKTGRQLAQPLTAFILMYQRLLVLEITLKRWLLVQQPVKRGKQNAWNVASTSERTPIKPTKLSMIRNNTYTLWISRACRN